MSSNASNRNPLEKLAEEFVERRRQGDQVTINDYAERFPKLAQQIRDLFPTLVVIERLGADTLEHEPAEPNREPPMLDRLGDYRILREVGRGGMGVVYEAEQESLGRRVALKVMLPSALMDARHLARFEREARAAASLHHTNIVPVFGVGRQDALHYFVMQLIEGQGLDKVLVELRRLRQQSGTSSRRGAKRDASQVEAGRAASAMSTDIDNLRGNGGENANGSDSAKDWNKGNGDSVGSASPISAASDSAQNYYRSAARLIIQAADALHYANAQGVLHRDVKPANLILDGSGTLWVTDFGLAKATDSDDLTNTGDIVGTLRYMAPERFENECTAQSDIYGLGLTLYELVTLRPAYDEVDRATLVARIIHDDPPQPRKIAGDIPRDLETILLKAVARRPASRYSTAGEFADDLRCFLDDRPIQARRIGPLERSWRWCRRNPLVASLTAGVIVLLVAVSVAYINTRSALSEASAARLAERDALGKADQRAADAEAAEKIAVDAVEQYFTTVSESRLLDVPGLQPLRRELLMLALSYYEKLIERSDKGEVLQWELALAHERVAVINQHIGSRAVAIQHFEKAISVHAGLRRSEPESTKFLHQAAMCHRKLGLLLRVDRRFGDAEQQLNSAVMLQQEAVALQPKNVELLIGLAYAYAYRGYTRSLLNKVQEGIVDCQRGVEILRELRDGPSRGGETTSKEIGKALAVVRNLQGNTVADDYRGNFSEAIEPFSEVVGYYRAQLQSEPATVFARSELARGLYNLGRARLATNDRPLALKHFEESLSIRRQLSVENPNVGEFVLSVVNTHRRIALVHGQLNQTDLVADHFRQAIEAQADLVRQNPDVISYQRTLSDLWSGLGQSQKSAGQIDDARASFKRAANVGEALLAAVDRSQSNLRFIAQTSNNVGALYRWTDDIESARQKYRQAIEAAAELGRLQGETGDYHLLIGMYNNNLGDLETTAGSTELALKAFAESIASYRKVLAAEPKHGRAISLLYTAHRLRATALDKSERFDEAVLDWAEARKWASESRRAYATVMHGLSLVQTGDHQAAAQAAEDLLPNDELAHDAAVILVGAYGAVALDATLEPTDQERLADKYAKRAVECLNTAHRAGFYNNASHRNKLRTGKDFDPLRDMADFKKLLAQLPSEPASN